MEVGVKKSRKNMELVPQILFNSCWAAALEMYFRGYPKQRQLLLDNSPAVVLDEDQRNVFYSNTCIKDEYLWHYNQLDRTKTKKEINDIIKDKANGGFLFYFKTDLSRDGAHVVYLSEYCANPFNYIQTFDPWPRCEGLIYFSTVEGIEWWMSKDPHNQGLLPCESGCYDVENRLTFSYKEELVNFLISNTSSFPYPSTDQWRQGRNCLKITFLQDSKVLQSRSWLGRIFTPNIDITEIVNLDYGEQYMIPFFDDVDNCTAVRINSTDAKGEKKWIINRFENASFLKDYSFLRPRKFLKKNNISGKQALNLAPISSKFMAVHFTQSDIFCLIEKIDKDYYQISDPYGCLGVLDFKGTQTLSEQDFIDKYLITYLSLTQKK
jgi:hypothetical protein